MRVDPIKRALELRKTLISDDRVLVTDFSNTLQGKDTSRVIDLMPIIGTKTYPFRTKVNVKEIDPFASEEYLTDFFDISNKTDQEIENFVKKHEFDFPLWFKNDPGFNMREINFYNPPFIFQIAGCNFHDGSAKGGCWYCFVDDASNDGIPSLGKTHLGISETLDSMLSARKQVREKYKEIGLDMDLRVLRASGGEPTIVLDWILNLWREVGKRNLDIFGQLDSNLSTVALAEDFEKKEIFEKHTLEKLAEYPIKVLTAIKGADEKNLQENVQAKTTIAAQEYSLTRLVKAGFEIFPQLYTPNPNSLRTFLEKMDRLIKNISLRMHIGPLKLYRPNVKRLTLEAQRQGIEPKIFIAQNKAKWDENYTRSCEIIDKYLRERHGVGYKEVTRADVKLELRQ